MTEEERERAQNAFMRGEKDVVVATNAFGMGIDRADIRFVAHFEVPGSIEAYYQEAGRAGRDDEAATCELFFNHADTRVQEFFIDGSNPSPAFITETYEMLRSEADEKHELQLSLKEMASRLDTDGNDMMLNSALHILDREGYIDRFDIPGRRVRGTRLLKPNVTGAQLKLDTAKLREKERRDREKLKIVIEFAYAHVCRQQAILRYFGEVDAEPCGNCDICLETAGPKRAPNDEESLVAGSVARRRNRSSIFNFARSRRSFSRSFAVSSFNCAPRTSGLSKRVPRTRRPGISKRSMYPSRSRMCSAELSIMSFPSNLSRARHFLDRNLQFVFFVRLAPQHLVSLRR